MQSVGTRSLRFAAPLLLLSAWSPASAADGALPGGLNSDTINRVPSSKPALVEAYASQSPHQIGELRLPKGRGPFPVAMLVHGGCWIAGLGRPRNLAPLATWLAGHGVASWNVDYREIGSGGGWPTSFEDWAAAAQHLRVLAKRYPLDLARLTVIGHSAGATAGLFLAQPRAADGPIASATPWPRPRPRPRAIVQFDGLVPQDYLLGPDAAMCGRPVIQQFMGGLPAGVPARYHAISPEASPPRVARALFVVAVLPPPPATTTAALRKAGARVEIIAPASPNHFDVIAPGTPNFTAIAPALLRAVRGR